jgi:hypothetical protein
MKLCDACTSYIYVYTYIYIYVYTYIYIYIYIYIRWMCDYYQNYIRVSSFYCSNNNSLLKCVVTNHTLTILSTKQVLRFITQSFHYLSLSFHLLQTGPDQDAGAPGKLIIWHPWVKWHHISDLFRWCLSAPYRMAPLTGWRPGQLPGWPAP